MSDPKDNPEDIILTAVRERVAFARQMAPAWPEKFLERLHGLEKLLCEQLGDKAFVPNGKEKVDEPTSP